MSEAEIQSIANSGQNPKEIFEDVDMKGATFDNPLIIDDPEDFLEGGAEINAHFVAKIDAGRTFDIDSSFYLPMTKSDFQRLYSEEEFLYYFYNIGMENSYKVRKFIWDQVQKRFENLNNSQFRADIPPGKSQRRAEQLGGTKQWTEPRLNIFVTESISLKRVYKTRESFRSLKRTYTHSRNESYTLDAILSLEETKEFLEILTEFALHF